MSINWKQPHVWYTHIQPAVLQVSVILSPDDNKQTSGAANVRHTDGVWKLAEKMPSNTDDGIIWRFFFFFRRVNKCQCVSRLVPDPNPTALRVTKGVTERICSVWIQPTTGDIVCARTENAYARNGLARQIGNARQNRVSNASVVQTLGRVKRPTAYRYSPCFRRFRDFRYCRRDRYLTAVPSLSSWRLRRSRRTSHAASSCPADEKQKRKRSVKIKKKIKKKRK